MIFIIAGCLVFIAWLFGILLMWEVTMNDKLVKEGMKTAARETCFAVGVISLFVIGAILITHGVSQIE